MKFSIVLSLCSTFIFLSIMMMYGVLADEQIVQGDIIISGFFTILVSYIVPYFLFSKQNYILLFLYGLFPFFCGIFIIYYDYILIGKRGFYAFGNPIPGMLIITGSLICILALYNYCLSQKYK